VSTTNTQGQHVVTAVIVAHDGAAWLPRIAEALLGQTRSGAVDWRTPAAGGPDEP